MWAYNIFIHIRFLIIITIKIIIIMIFNSDPECEYILQLDLCQSFLKDHGIHFEVDIVLLA